MNTAIIIPAFNEKATIAAVVAGVAGYGLPIVVDDASTDGTGTLAGEAGAEVVINATNRGYDGALQMGFEKADALGVEIAVTFDADGQHGSDVLERMLAPLRGRGADLVIGVRPTAARPAERLFNAYARWRFGVPDILCGVKAYRMSLYRAHGRFDGSHSLGTELALSALRGGARFELQTVPIAPRDGTPRVGRALSANAKVLSALWGAVKADLGQRSGELYT
jgi:glycosyltransferase involved in cell wall biosynthesis